MSPTSHFLRSAHNAYSVQNIFSVSSDGLSHIITNPPLQQNWVSMYGVLVSLQATSLTSSWAVTEMFYDLLEQCNICKRNQVHLLHDCVGVRQYAYVHTVLQLQSRQQSLLTEQAGWQAELSLPDQNWPLVSFFNPSLLRLLPDIHPRCTVSRFLLKLPFDVYPPDFSVESSFSVLGTMARSASGKHSFSASSAIPAGKFAT